MYKSEGFQYIEDLLEDTMYQVIKRTLESKYGN